MIFGIVVIAAFSMILNAPGLLLMWLILSSPFLAWWLLEMLTKSFVATDRRVIFRSRVWPHRWSYWNYAELNEHLVRVGSPKRIIHLSLFMMGARGEPSWQYNWAVYPTYIENVPDVEAVRELILEKIRNKPAPVDDSGKPPAQEPQRTYPPVYGTRTG